MAYTYKYIFNDGTIDDIEVDEATYEALRKWDRKERYNNEKNITVDLAVFTKNIADGLGANMETIIEDKNLDVWTALRVKELEEIEIFEDKCWEAKWLDIKDKLLELLTFNQAYSYYHSELIGMKKTDIAREMGVSEGLIRKFIKKAEMNLEKQGIEELVVSDRTKLMWEQLEKRKNDFLSDS